jgi:2-oxo-3-hexenedioate decarboxylase
VTLDQTVIEALAVRLDEAAQNHAPIVKITDDYPDMDWRDAYAVQAALLARKIRRGERFAGYKAGLTSFAKMQQMAVDEPVMGVLTDAGMIADGGAIDTAALIHPRVEAEIAFVLKAALSGPDCTINQVLAATDFILPAVEVIDSRYKDFKFDLKSVVADNTSAARFVTGGRACKIDAIDLPNLGMGLEKNGEIVATAAGSAVLGHPALSVALLVNMLAQRGEMMPAGTFVMTGGATEAVSVAAGDIVTMRCQHLGSVSMRFT